MKFHELCNLAVYDMKKNKKITYQLFRSFFIVCIIIFSGCLFYMGIAKKYAYIVYSTTSSNRIMTTLDLTKKGTIIENKAKKLSDWLEKQPNVLGYNDKAQIDLLSLCKKENWSKVNIKYVQLNIEGKTYQGNNDYSYDFEEPYSLKNNKSMYSVFFTIDTIYCKEGIANANDRKEFDYDYPKEQIFLAGNSPQNSGEVVLSDYMLKRFGLEEKWEDYIGKKISFDIDGTNVLKDYKIVGIINSNFFRLESHTMDSQVIIYGNADIYRQYHIESLTRSIPVQDYLNTEKLISKIPKKWEDEYYASLLMDEYYYLTRIKLIADHLVTGIGGVLLLAVGINLYTILWEQSKHRKKTFGLFQAIGMETGNILKFQAVGYLFLLCMAFLFAFILGFFLISSINSILSSTIFIEINLSWKEYLISSMCVAFVVLVYICMVSYALYNNQMRQKVSDLLRK